VFFCDQSNKSCCMIFWYRGSCHFCCFLYLTKLKIIIIIMKIKYFRCQIKSKCFSSPHESPFLLRDTRGQTPQSIDFGGARVISGRGNASHALASKDKSDLGERELTQARGSISRRKCERCQIAGAPNPLALLNLELTSIFGCQIRAPDLNRRRRHP
jgi:hypothetical protein